LNQMCSTLGDGHAVVPEIKGLWYEYENGETNEAKLVKDFDKIEMIMQALEYEEQQGKDLSEFFASVDGKLQTDTGKQWANEIVAQRSKNAQKH